MPRSIQLLIVLAAITIAPASTPAAEVWTYQFTPDLSRPYRQDCDLCLSTNLGTRADLAGTFTILLDWENGTGRLLQLNDHLVNIATVTNTFQNPILVPATPSEQDHEVVPPWHSFPIPPGRFSYVNGVGHLLSNNYLDPTEPYFGLNGYDITFDLHHASLSIELGIIDLSIGASRAPAKFSNAFIAGDFNNDGRVNTSDYVLLRKNANPPLDYNLWRTYYGVVHNFPSADNVPEPSTIILAIAAASLFASSVRRPNRRPLDGHI